MKNNKASGYKTRDAIMKLLSDEEVARVSTTEAANHLSANDEYIDLEHPDLGVRQATGKTSPIENVLSKKAVHEKTWQKILAQLAVSRSA